MQGARAAMSIVGKTCIVSGANRQGSSGSVGHFSSALKRGLMIHLLPVCVLCCRGIGLVSHRAC